MPQMVYLNGKFIVQSEAGIPVTDAGFTCGFGVFESMRSFKNRIVDLSGHLKRIKRSASALGIGFPYSLSELSAQVKETARLNMLEDAYIRLTLWKNNKGRGILIFAKPYKVYPEEKYKMGFSAGVSALRQQDIFLAGFKTTSRLLYELSFSTAKRNGFDEAVILNNRGYITEGSRSNIFFVKDGCLFTPDLFCGCLGGITRKFVFNFAKKRGLKIYSGNYTLNDLFRADEAFLTNSLRGIMSLARVNGEIIAKRNGLLTGEIAKVYNRLTYGIK